MGRLDELSAFEDNLKLGVEDPRRRFLHWVHGQGGMGKTSLLRRYRELLDQTDVPTAWADEQHTDPVSVMRRWSSDLAESNNHFKPFVDKERAYQEHRHKLEADPTLPSEVAELIGRAVGRGAVVVGRRVPVAGVALDFVEEKNAADTFGKAAAHIAQRIGNSKSDVELVSRPLETLTPVFLECLNNFESVGLFLDTFEATGPVLEPWLLDVLDGRYGDLPGGLSVGIAGRESLDANIWSDLEDVISLISLAPFSEIEAREFLTRHSVTDPRVIDVMLELSGRMPLLLATLASQAPSSLEDLVDATGTAIERFLKWIDEPARRHLALVASVPRVLNDDVLGVLLSEEPGANFEWLKGMPFVSVKSGRRVYHQTVRELMLRQLRRESPGEYTRAHRALHRHYEELASSDGTLLSAKRREAELEAAYHSCAASGRATLPVLCDWIKSLPDFETGHLFGEALRQAEIESETEQEDAWGPLLRGAAGHDATFDLPIKSRDCVAQILDSFSSQMSDLDRTNAIATRSICDLVLDQPSSAAKGFREAFDMDPIPSRRLLLAIALDAADLTEDASEEFDEVLRAGELPEHLQVDALMFRAFSVGGSDPASAIKDIEAAMALRPSPRLTVAHASFTAATGDDTRALALLEGAVNEHPESADRFHATAAGIHARAGRHGAAERSSLLGIRTGPDNLANWSSLGRSLRAQGQTPLRIQTTIDGAGESLIGRAEAFEVARLRSLAISRYTSAIEANGNSSRALASRGVLTLDDAPSAALSDLERAVRLEPGNAWTRTYLGVALAACERASEALDEYDVAIALPGTPNLLWWYRSVAKRSRGDLRGALLDAEEYVKRAPEDPDGHLLCGDLSSDLGQYQDGLDYLERGFSLVPSQRSTRPELLVYGLTLAALGRFEEAHASFKKYHRAADETEGAAVIYNIAVAAIRGGLSGADAALNLARSTIERLPHGTFDRAYGLAGLEALGGSGLALAALSKARKINPAKAAIWAQRDMAWSELHDDPEFVKTLLHQT